MKNMAKDKIKRCDYFTNVSYYRMQGQNQSVQIVERTQKKKCGLLAAHKVIIGEKGVPIYYCRTHHYDAMKWFGGLEE